jgi:hypothetical protein
MSRLRVDRNVVCPRLPSIYFYNHLSIVQFKSASVARPLICM